MNVSFLHSGGSTLASYRYRADIPARALGASVNSGEANVLIFAKPVRADVARLEAAKARGCTVVVDICDPHLQLPHYQTMIAQADIVTAPTAFLAQLIEDDCGIAHVHVVPDPYEYDEQPPHVRGSRLLWFGHPTNLHSLERVLPMLTDYDLRIVTTFTGEAPAQYVQWSPEALREELSQADIVLMPESAPYKSANRTIEAIRAGCFVVAEPHPSLNDIPGIYIGNLIKGVAWASQNPSTCNDQLMPSQAYVRARYSPERVASVWRTILPASRCN